MLHSDETKNIQLNIRINPAEKAMIEAVNRTMRPRISIAKMLVYLCEEKAREQNLIQDDGDGNWLIAEPVSHGSPDPR